MLEWLDIVNIILGYKYSEPIHDKIKKIKKLLFYQIVLSKQLIIKMMAHWNL